MTHQVVLHNWQQAADVLNRMSAWLKPRMISGHRFELTLKEPSRSSEQNAKLHAMLMDIARQIEWAGKKRTAEVWKRLLVAAWLREQGEHLEVLPALDGHGVDVIFERTSKLSVARMVSLIEYVMAWGSQAGVNWSE